MRFTPVLPVLLVLAAAAAAAPRDATRVVHRGPPDLATALRIATGRDGRVSLVVDVTPYTAARDRELYAALQKLGATGAWRIARLGEPLSPPAPTAEGLIGHFPRVFAKPSDVTSTLIALRKTLRSHKGGGTVVYLADWHFEDHEALEGLVREFKRTRVRFSVVGSEAAYGRPWNDGFDPSLPDLIGRHAFETLKPGVPFHTGDSAYPHAPWSWSLRWSTKFPAERKPTPRWEDRHKSRYANDRRRRKPGADKDEDLAERMDRVDRKAMERYAFALPSSYGPYALMRLCAETGGTYVLWSWNPEGRSDVRYDFGRCNLFPPDLRSRDEILRDARQRPAARALASAWNEIANRDVQVARITPPLTRNAAAPMAMDFARGRGGLSYRWRDAYEWKLFLKRAPRTLEALDRAIGLLGRGLQRPPADAVDRRYHADADLMRHVLRVLRFQLGEALAEARRLPKTAWRDESLHPGLDPVRYLDEGPDVVPHVVRIHDTLGGATVVKDRQRMLTAYRGTPFGEQVDRNAVYTYKLDWRPVGRGKPAKRTPAESDSPRPSTPGGGSRGGGPTTGG